jgi:alpha-tubulin suppressor-like RCC1 family protein
LALKEDGRVLAWGLNEPKFNQTVVPPLSWRVLGIAAGGDHSLVVEQTGQVTAWGPEFGAMVFLPNSAKRWSLLG